MQVVYIIKMHDEEKGLIHIKIGRTGNIKNTLSSYSRGNFYKPEVIALFKTGETSIEKCERGVLGISKNYCYFKEDNNRDETRKVTSKKLEEMIKHIGMILVRVDKKQEEKKDINNINKKTKLSIGTFIEELNSLGFQVIEDSNKKWNRWKVKKNNKLFCYLHDMKYGVAYQTHKNGKWHTDRIQTINEMNKKIQEIKDNSNESITVKEGTIPTVEMFIERLTLLGIHVKDNLHGDFYAKRNNKHIFHFHRRKYGFNYREKNSDYSERIRTKEEMEKKLQEIELKFDDRN
jgi:hypothetical protein